MATHKGRTTKRDYRKLLAVFTDVWLFDQLLGPEGKPANPQLVEVQAQLEMAYVY